MSRCLADRLVSDPPTLDRFLADHSGQLQPGLQLTPTVVAVLSACAQ